MSIRRHRGPTQVDHAHQAGDEGDAMLSTARWSLFLLSLVLLGWLGALAVLLLAPQTTLVALATR